MFLSLIVVKKNSSVFPRKQRSMFKQTKLNINPSTTDNYLVRPSYCNVFSFIILYIPGRSGVKLAKHLGNQSFGRLVYVSSHVFPAGRGDMWCYVRVYNVTAPLAWHPTARLGRGQRDLIHIAAPPT